jgi:hypothetical protein
MLKLEKQEERQINGQPSTVRIYRNTATESVVETYLILKDPQGNKWWTFLDLFSLPFIRQLAAKKVLDLYGHGLKIDDIKAITSQVKATLRSDSPEKYDLAMAKILELENLTDATADPVKQCIGLCTVYLLLNDENPDVWTNQESSAKMSLLSMDAQLQAFFLNWWTVVMRRSGSILKGLSRIASAVNGQSANLTEES